MLRIRYKNRSTVFEMRGVKKVEVRELIESHLSIWAKEQIVVDGQPRTVDIPRDLVIAEWQEGDSWVDGAPTEVIPVPA